MAESLIDIKRRISSTKSTQQITKAMQMVSASKLSQVTQRAKNYQVYTQKVRDIVVHLAASQVLNGVSISNDDGSSNLRHISTSSLLIQRPIKKTAYLVITSDRGLVGSYNSTILKNIMSIISKKDPSEYSLIAIGGMGADFFKARNLNVSYEYRGVSDIPTFDEVREIVTTVVSMYDASVFDELFVCYNHFVNSLSSAFRVEKMLPIVDLDTSEVNEKIDYISDSTPEEALDVILPQYAESLIYGAIIDAKTAEHASSTTAMSSASDNADDLISKLSIRYNRARQAKITTEITEIVGGAAALE
ncbi:F0F1 ATP synthase subunit gamma [Agrilactobacillus yilanensis]|uniref:ATP synthase gamma chain n=1 Tax=Agrilactobacillus yilanensis TaxID=2485997 RepID=A0ABW4J4F5_9LACO|nr:F0F1 ATP synthase subunit gamma [Agrilactobacillus yilanensis]